MVGQIVVEKYSKKIAVLLPDRLKPYLYFALRRCVSLDLFQQNVKTKYACSVHKRYRRIKVAVLHSGSS